MLSSSSTYCGYPADCKHCHSTRFRDGGDAKPDTTALDTRTVIFAVRRTEAAATIIESTTSIAAIRSVAIKHIAIRAFLPFIHITHYIVGAVKLFTTTTYIPEIIWTSYGIHTITIITTCTYTGTV